MDIWKIVIISAVVSANMIVWYEILGFKFLFGVAIVIACIVLFPKRRGK